jgi:two-component system cell cycle sensor histidine kinase/response regulator CckA
MNYSTKTREQLLTEVQILRARLAQYEQQPGGSETQAQQALRESDARRAAILQTALDAIISMDQEGRVVEFNPAAERTFGFRLAEVLGQPLAEFIIPPSLREAHQRGLAHFLASGSGPVLNRRIEITALRADGTEFPVELAITPFEAGGSWVFTAYIRDITERKNAERRLEAQHTVTRALAETRTLDEAAPKVLRAVCENLGWHLGQMWQVDLNAGVLGCAAVWHEPAVAVATFAELSRGTTFSPGVGLPGRVWANRRPCWVSDVVTDANFPRAEAAVHCGLHGAFAFPILCGEEMLGVVEFFHHEIREPDEPLLAMIAAVGSQLGQFIERKRAEDALRRSEAQLLQSQKMEAVGQLAGGIAHDFNNLLTVILGYSEILLGGQGPAEGWREPLEAIKQSGQRAASLTRQLLAFSRKQVLEQRMLSLNAIVADLEKMLRRLIGEDIDLETCLEPQLEPVKADPGQLEQVIMNLVINARDAMPRGGKLIVQTRNVVLDKAFASARADVHPGRHVELAVSDTGCGMTEEVKARVFEPFFTTKEVGQGTGLGLATVYGIVKQSGGHLEVLSEVDRGTTFKIYLPGVEKAVGAQKSDPGLSKVSRGKETVLLVEDEEQVRALSRHILEAQGYTVLEAGHGAEAIRVSNERLPGPIHLLITDVVMPHVGGRELAERLALTRREMKVLFVSGYTDDAVVRHGVLAAETAFLQKPFTPSALAMKVREVLDK